MTLTYDVRRPGIHGQKWLRRFLKWCAWAEVFSSSAHTLGVWSWIEATWDHFCSHHEPKNPKNRPSHFRPCIPVWEGWALLIITSVNKCIMIGIYPFRKVNETVMLCIWNIIEGMVKEMCAVHHEKRKTLCTTLSSFTWQSDVLVSLMKKRTDCSTLDVTMTTVMKTFREYVRLPRLSHFMTKRPCLHLGQIQKWCMLVFEWCQAGLDESQDEPHKS